MKRLIFLSLALIAALIAAAPAGATIVIVTADDCAAITAHEPADDVAYEPGVDVDGNAVASADLYDSGRIDYNADDIVISIGNPLVATAGVVGDEAAFVAAGGRIDSFGADSSVGSVTLRNGEVYFNGRRITDNEARAIALACAEVQ